MTTRTSKIGKKSQKRDNKVKAENNITFEDLYIPESVYKKIGFQNINGLVTRISVESTEAVEKMLFRFIDGLIKHAHMYMGHAKRTTLSEKDIDMALEFRGMKSF